MLIEKNAVGTFLFFQHNCSHERRLSYFRIVKMYKLFFFLALFWLPIFKIDGQTSFFRESDSLSKKRFVGVSSGTGILWAGSMTGLYQVWYSKTERSPFHTFNDSKNWLQMDKMGHTYTAYKITEVTHDLYNWSGFDRKKGLAIASATGWGYQATLELFDAYSADWGFSWSDLFANTAGSGLYIGQELLWNEQRILPKFSYSPTIYAQYRPEVLGSTYLERLLKDYNGQTYWLSVSPGSFLKNSTFPKWLCFSIGYSADQRLVGDQSFFIGNLNGIEKEFHSKREFILSLDLDLTRLNVKKPWLKSTLKQLNHLKIPFPALILSGNDLKGHFLYF